MRCLDCGSRTGRTPDDALDYSAVQLFVARARQARMDFDLGADDLRYLARICRLVGGMPLGLALAASWVDLLSVREIADEIGASVDFLESEAQDLPDRQRSIRAVFEYSWGRLSAAAQEQFMRLAVFRGGFSRRAAEHIAGATLRSLQTLMNHALVTRVGDDRYAVHALLRQYAEDALARAGALDETRDRHSVYYLAALADRENEIKGRRQFAALGEIAADFENVRAAWSRAAATVDVESIDRSLETLFWFCFMRDRLYDGEELIGDALASGLAEHPLIMARVGTRLAVMQRMRLGRFEDPARARTSIEHNLSIVRQHNDQRATAFHMMALGMIAVGQRQYDEALSSFADMIARYKDLGDDFYHAWGLHFLGMIYGYNRDVAKNYETNRDCLDIRERLGDDVGACFSRCNMAMEAFWGGQYREGFDLSQSGLRLSKRIGLAGMEGVSLYGLSLASFHSGDFAQARTLAEQAYQLGVDTNLILMQAWASSLLAWIACVDGTYDEAERMLARIPLLQRLEVEVSVKIGYAMAATGKGDYTRARQEFGSVPLPALGTGGRTWMLPVAALILAHEGRAEDAIELLGLAFAHERSPVGWYENWPLLTQLRDDLRAELGEAAYEAAFARGAGLDLDAVYDGLRAEFVEGG